jgi:hypothetical protein
MPKRKRPVISILYPPPPYDRDQLTSKIFMTLVAEHTEAMLDELAEATSKRLKVQNTTPTPTSTSQLEPNQNKGQWAVSYCYVVKDQRTIDLTCISSKWKVGFEQSSSTKKYLIYFKEKEKCHYRAVVADDANGYTKCTRSSLEFPQFDGKAMRFATKGKAGEFIATYDLYKAENKLA